MAQIEVHNVGVTLNWGGTGTVGTVTIPALKVPADSVGGGITITAVKFYSRDAIAAASAPQYTVITLGTNDQVNGTVTTALGSEAWTAGTARTGTISGAFCDANYVVAIREAQTAANATALFTKALITYVMGY